MSEVLKRVIEILNDDAPVSEVAVYLHATVVRSRRTGLAYTFSKHALEEPKGRHDVIANHGHLTDFMAKELAAYALSSHLAEASVGIAAINSLIEPDHARLIDRSGVDLVMERAASRRLAVVGHFPFVERVRPLVKTLWVLELDPAEGDLPASEAPNIIPHADVVAITGTTLINHTIDGLLEMAKGKQVIVMGPSTILSPVLLDLGVSALCGVLVTDPELALSDLKEGGCFRNLKGVRHVALMR
ncbi:MAG: DUF364 domain-containing protein [bacterium]